MKTKTTRKNKKIKIGRTKKERAGGRKWLILSLVGIFFLVLFLNSYFNYTSGIAINDDGSNLGEKFYLSGPDPYYNVRLLKETMETGRYPFLGGKYGGEDPLLNYPLGGSGGRPPLFNMITMGVSKLLSPFIGEMDALGYAMQFLPALYGALLVIPVYYIGKTLFNRKAAIIAAMLIPLIPIHISSGHGSAYSLYDHDSLVILLFSITFMFLLMSLKEKNAKRSTIYAVLSGVFVASISMTWVSAQYVYALIAVYAIVQMVMDIFTQKISFDVVRTTLVTLFVGYVLSFPLFWIKHGFSPDLPLFICIGVAAFSSIYIWLGRNRIPWLISLPSIFGMGGVGIAFLYLIRDTSNSLLGPLTALSNILFGGGIYGEKVSLTIAEAGTFGLSRTVMSFGPVVYWLGWAGFILLLYRYYKKRRREYLFLATWFMVEIWLCTTAGRFLNDLVPLMAILGGWIAWLIIEKIDFSDMVNTVRGIGGGWYGIKKGVKARHIAGAAFIAFFIMIPNGWMAFDASVPSIEKRDFGLEGGAFGLGLHTEEYWTDALGWLSEQDNEINDSSKRPAFIAWWDYGFYESAIGGHPTVADNFQEGIPPAANFHTAANEIEAVAVWIVRLADGNMKKNNGELSPEVIDIFDEYLKNESENLTNILEEPINAPSYNTLVCPQYQKEKYKLPIPSLWPVKVREKNAMYHDATAILTKLSDDEITWLYHDMQNVTGYSIRYYGVEGYDINIFNVFSFLADKGIFMYATREDDYFRLDEWYVDQYGNTYTPEEVENMTRQEMEELELEPIREMKYKDAFFNTMVYKTYLGISVPKQIFENQTKSFQYMQYLYMFMQPTVGLRHFAAEYVSPMTENKSLYFARGQLCFGCPAVVIAKYYEGAEITGTIKSDGESLAGINVEIQRNATLFGQETRITHDFTTTNENGSFSLIAPAGNISLLISKGTGGDRMMMKRIIFNGTEAFSPITDEDAMRRSPTWQRDIGIVNIKRGSVEGIAFWDKDGDGKYNESVDEPMRNVEITIGEEEKKTNSNGRYSFYDLIPGTYTITATKKGYDDGSARVSIEPNATATQNISMIPSKVTISGITWYDADKNGRMDENESITNVPIEFVVIDAPDENAVNATAMSNSTGHYEKSLFPATYKIEVNYIQGNETYIYSDEIEIRIGDSDKTRNIKLEKVED